MVLSPLTPSPPRSGTRRSGTRIPPEYNQLQVGDLPYWSIMSAMGSPAPHSHHSLEGRRSPHTPKAPSSILFDTEGWQRSKVPFGPGLENWLCLRLETGGRCAQWEMPATCQTQGAAPRMMGTGLKDTQYLSFLGVVGAHPVVLRTPSWLCHLEELLLDNA